MRLRNGGVGETDKREGGACVQMQSMPLTHTHTHTHPSLFFRCSPPQDGDTPYDVANAGGHTKIMELLVTEEDKLREAAENGNDDDVRSLLDNQVNVNAADWVSTSARLSRRPPACGVVPSWSRWA